MSRGSLFKARPAHAPGCCRSVTAADEFGLPAAAGERLHNAGPAEAGTSPIEASGGDAGGRECGRADA